MTGLPQFRGPRAAVRGPLLECQETRFTYRMTVTNLMLFQQPVADQKIYPALADFDRATMTPPLELRSRRRLMRTVDVGSWVI